MKKRKDKTKVPAPKTKDVPETLKPYVFHGIELNWTENTKTKDVVGTCPWCGRDKFSVKVATGIWQCFVCQEGSAKGGGNATTFIRSLHKLSMEQTKESDYVELQKERKLLDFNTLKSWGVCKSITTNRWLVPGYGVDVNLNNVYQYTPIVSKSGTKNRLLPTPTLGHQLHGMNLYDPKKKTVDILEGPWDGMALWEIFKMTTMGGSGIELLLPWTKGLSLLSNRNVLSVPGTKTFFQSWVDMLAGKVVNIWYDSDKPKTLENGREVEPAGIEGVKRVTSLLYQAKKPPKEVNYIHWGDDGFDPELPDGHDVRDHLRSYNA